MDKQTVTLIRAAQNGNQNAFHQLVSQYDSRIMGLALQLLKNKEDAEDIYQEVFLKAWRSLDSFEFKSDFYTWLYRITTNSCYSYKTGKQRHHMENISLEEGYHDAYEDERLDGRDDQQAGIIAAVDQLPQKQKTVFILRYYQGHKIQDIANLLGCTTGTIKRYLHRATHKLRRELAEYA